MLGMKTQFIPIDYEAFDFNSRNFIRIIGRNENGKRICVIDKFKGYFWVILKPGLEEKEIKKVQEKIEKIQVEKANRISKVEKTEMHYKKFLGKDVKALKVFITNYKDAHDIADKMDFIEIDKRREYDIPIVTRYIMNNGLKPLEWHEIEGCVSELGKNIDVELCLEVERVKKIDSCVFQPRILAYDIEASEFETGKGEILMISLYGKGYKKVLTWKKCSKKQDYVECFSNEEEMIEKFIEYVHEYEPDLLVGYFSDGFDLPYLRQRAEVNKIKLSIGLDGSQPIFSKGRLISGRIFGIVHVDLYRFIEAVFSQYLQSETLSLDEVAGELLGIKKKEFDFSKLGKMKEDDWRDFFEYNIHDSYLAYSLSEKLWPDMVEFSKILQEPLFEITRDRMSSHVENYILHNLERFNEIAEKRPIHDEIGERQNREKYEGAFVFQPTPGLYEDICIFDFTSYWPSIIVTYNLSKSSFLQNKEKDSLEVDIDNKKYYFSKRKSFFTEMLNEIIEKRKKYKQEYKKDENPITKARSNAYKLLANASYGYLGFFGARYYCPEAGASATAISRDFTKKTIGEINRRDYEVIYSDTDSICFKLNKHSKEDALKLLEDINKNLPGIMELELEDFFKRGIWVTKRTGEFGAKKKYALINEKGKMKIRGFETVRRDWCALARELQSRILELILREGNEKKALELVKETIVKLKERKIEKEQIMIRTQLKKPLDEYKAITPHVIAGQKLKEQGMPVKIGMLIEYFIAETREKKALVREKVKLPDEKGEYNIEYYLNNQLLPAVENILEVFGVNIKEVIDGERQKKLF
jgi:DNA polymerase I/DNA polymerase-2